MHGAIHVLMVMHIRNEKGYMAFIAFYKANSSIYP